MEDGAAVDVVGQRGNFLIDRDRIACGNAYTLRFCTIIALPLPRSRRACHRDTCSPSLPSLDMRASPHKERVSWPMSLQMASFVMIAQDSTIANHRTRTSAVVCVKSVVARHNRQLVANLKSPGTNRPNFNNNSVRYRLLGGIPNPLQRALQNDGFVTTQVSSQHVTTRNVIT